MRSFSQELAEDRRFEIGGETFTWIYPYWEEMASIFDEDVETLKEHEAEKNGGPPTTKETIAKIQKRILVFLPPEDHTRFKALTKRKAPAVPTFQFGELYTHLLEVSGKRPTQPSSVSPAGDGNSDSSSEDASS